MLIDEYHVCLVRKDADKTNDVCCGMKTAKGSRLNTRTTAKTNCDSAQQGRVVKTETRHAANIEL